MVMVHAGERDDPPVGVISQMGPSRPLDGDATAQSPLGDQSFITKLTGDW